MLQFAGTDNEVGPEHGQATALCLACRHCSVVRHGLNVVSVTSGVLGGGRGRAEGGGRGSKNLSATLPMLNTFTASCRSYGETPEKLSANTLPPIANCN